MLYACDGKWWDKHPDAHTFAGLRFTQDRKAALAYGLTRVPAIGTVADLGRGLGFCLKPPFIHTGASSGYQAANLALHLGARRIVLLGFDVQAPAGKSHWHGEHGDGLNNPTIYTFQSWLENWATVPASIAGTGLEIVNATRETALTMFPRMTLEEALR